MIIEGRLTMCTCNLLDCPKAKTIALTVESSLLGKKEMARVEATLLTQDVVTHPACKDRN